MRIQCSVWLFNLIFFQRNRFYLTFLFQHWQWQLDLLTLVSGWTEVRLLINGSNILGKWLESSNGNSILLCIIIQSVQFYPFLPLWINPCSLNWTVFKEYPWHPEKKTSPSITFNLFPGLNFAQSNLKIHSFSYGPILLTVWHCRLVE